MRKCLAPLFAVGLAYATARVCAAKERNSMKLTSPAFANRAEIPSKYTCEGADRSPPLQWSELPAGSKSLALVIDDPDAPDPASPKTTWSHWILYNLPAQPGGLAEAIAPSALPPGTLEGLNDWRSTGYRGPCPPIGRHRYVHKLYALGTVLPDLHKPTRAVLLKAMEGHILAEAEWFGNYQKKR
jgi:Raf kinase inhibitor-like YbhB/YbcL family protein